MLSPQQFDAGPPLEVDAAHRSEEHENLLQLAQTIFPGGTTNSLVPPRGLEFIIEYGKGPYVYDVDGHKHLDFLMGAGSVILGHAHPRIADALQRAAALGTQHFGLNRRAVELAERIIAYVPCAEMIRFTASGTEATFHALRLARAVTGRSAIAKCIGAFHGHHDLAVWSLDWSFKNSTAECGTKAVPASAGVQRGVADDMHVVPFNDAEAVKDLFSAHGSKIAAFIVEPLQRILPPVPGFLETIRLECDRHGAILVFDEVVTGFRLAKGGGQERYGVIPDLTTLGKAVASGVPIGILCGKRHLMEHLSPNHPQESRNFHCGTYNGNLMAVSCAHTTLDLLVEENGISRLEYLGTYARNQMAKIFRDHGEPVHVQGEGPMFHPFFSEHKVVTPKDVSLTNWPKSNAFHLKLASAGVFKTFSKAYLSLAHSESEIDELCSIASWALSELE